jgi:hypothetical protein
MTKMIFCPIDVEPLPISLSILAELAQVNYTFLDNLIDWLKQFLLYENRKDMRMPKHFITEN